MASEEIVGAEEVKDQGRELLEKLDRVDVKVLLIAVIFLQVGLTGLLTQQVFFEEEVNSTGVPDKPDAYLADITIDGNSISGITIDGQQVQEVTVDGDVVWTAGPTVIDDFEGDTDGWSSADSSKFFADNNRSYNGSYSVKVADDPNDSYKDNTYTPWPDGKQRPVLRG